jgi:hypothetical protein
LVREGLQGTFNDRVVSRVSINHEGNRGAAEIMGRMGLPQAQYTAGFERLANPVDRGVGWLRPDRRADNDPLERVVAIPRIAAATPSATPKKSVARLSST